MKPKTEKPKRKYRIEFDFIDRLFHVKWKDNRGNRCYMTFGTEAAAKEWAAQEESRDGQPYVKGQS